MDNQKESREILCLKIGQWAFKELGYSEVGSMPNDVSNCSAFKNLSIGNNGRLWEAVVKNVKRVNPRGSALDLNVNKQKEMKVLSDLQERSKTLDFELLQEKTNMEMLQEKAGNLQDKIDGSYKDIIHLSNMTELLEAKSTQTNSKRIHFSRINNGLQNKMESLKKPEEQNDKSLAISNTCQKKQIKKASSLKLITDIEKEIYKLCYNHASGKTNLEPMSKKMVVSQIMALMRTTSLKTISQCLSASVQTSMDDVTKFINAFNIKREMYQLGYIPDLCKNNSEMEIAEIEDNWMEEQISKLRATHVKLGLEYSEERKELQRLVETKNNLLHKRECLIQDGSKVQMVLSLLDLQLDIGDCETKISVLKDKLGNELQELKNNTGSANLEEQLETIQETEKIIQQKHSMILSTITSNNEMKTAISNCFFNLKDVKSTFSQMNITNLLSSVEIWKEQLVLSRELFCSLKMMSFISLQNTLLPFFNIMQNLSEQNPFLNQIKTSYRISRAQSIDYLLKSVMCQKANYITSELIFTKQMDFLSELKNIECLQRRHTEEYQHCLQNFDLDIEVNCLPKIKEVMDKIPEIKALCKEAGDEIIVWWTLPAYHIKV